MYAGLEKLGLGVHATGLALAALVLGGYRLWTGVALGALATSLWTGTPPLVGCGIAVGNTLAAVSGAFALRRIPGFRGTFERFAEVLGLAVLAATLSTLISATIGTASLALGHAVPRADVARLWRVWWTGDLLGDLIVAPLLAHLGGCAGREALRPPRRSPRSPCSASCWSRGPWPSSSSGPRRCAERADRPCLPYCSSSLPWTASSASARAGR